MQRALLHIRKLVVAALPGTMFLLRLAFGGLFIYAAIDKGMRPPDPNMPWANGTMYGNIIAGRLWLHYVFVGCEFVLGAWLVSGLATRKAALASIITLCVFTGLIGHELSKDHPKPCGCMSDELYVGREQVIRQSLYWSVGRNVGLLAVGTALFLYAGAEQRRRLAGAAAASSAKADAPQEQEAPA